MNGFRTIGVVIRAQGWKIAGLAAVLTIHFLCFYWWIAGSYHFSGDGLFYFSNRITSFASLWEKFVSLDGLYQYRPLSYVIFSFVLYPLFGTSQGPYHVVSYAITLASTLLACVCCYFWLGRDKRRTVIASVFLLLNPVNFFLSFGLTYLDVFLSVLFYLLALVLILADTKWTFLLAPVFAVLALLSREHSVVLPAQALLILVATGVPLRHALSRTRNVWLVVAVYAVFQLIIRQGAIFAPESANENLQFRFSMERVEDLVKGMRAATYFPENPNLNEFLDDYRRPARLAFVFPWLGMILWALLRRNKAALFAFLWVPISLLPIAFIQFPPFPRHYYLALPGLAVLFASVVPNVRALVYVAAVLSLVTVTNVAMYAQSSWVATGSRTTKKYLEEIDSVVNRNGRRNFYVLNEGDRHFFWHIDGGVALHHFLHKPLSFRFAPSAMPMDLLLSNSMNVVVPTGHGFQDALTTGAFPKFGNAGLCGPVRRLTESDAECAVFFRGLPVETTETAVVETPNGMPIIDLENEIVTLSRTTVFLKTGGGVSFNATLRTAPESADGVTVQIAKMLNKTFTPVFQSDIAPGEQIYLEKMFDAAPASMFALRVGPGAKGDETGDWLIWTISPSEKPLMPPD